MGSPAPDTPTARPPVTDSPWFWACLFATVGLGALWAIDQRYDARQTQVEQKAQARLRAAEQETSGEPSTEVSQRGNLLVTIRPLFGVLGGVLIVAWIVLWWQHLRVAR